MKYTEEHLWLRDEDDAILIGISEQGIEEIGEVIFVDLPEVGQTVTKDEEIIVIESSDSATDLLAPIDGEVVEVNENFADTPGLLNEDPIGAGWFIKIEASDPSQFDDYIDEAGYRKFIA